jgi:hypothetical protein
MRAILAVGVAGLAACFLFYLACLNYLEPTQVGISWNYASGESQLQEPGWHITSPLVAVARIDTRPVRVCITSASRGFNCRLVQFEPSGYQQFIATQGFYYYWWSNRISFNWGYNEEYRGMRDLMRGYAYSVKQYPFIKALREYGPGE